MNILKETHSYELGYLAIMSYAYPVYFIDYTNLSIFNLLQLIYISDFVSGLLHIFLDDYKGENPYIKPHALGFQNHHKNPKEFTERPIFTVFTETGQSVLLFNILNSYFLSFYFLIFTGLINIVQLSHYQAHCINHNTFSKPVSDVFIFLQKYGLILSTDSHSKHHQTYDNNFCILTGWANPLLNRYYKLAKSPENNNNLCI